jgi:hypothetical protein
MEQESELFRREVDRPRTSLVREGWDFLNATKKWWLLPILVVLLAVGLLIILGGTAAAPFIYTLF